MISDDQLRGWLAGLGSNEAATRELIDELLSKRRILEDWEEPTRLLRARVRNAALDEAAALVEHHGEPVLAEAILALKED